MRNTKFSNPVTVMIMRHLLVILFPILLMESVMGIERERKAKFQAFVEQLYDESPKKRESAYTELRDKHVRKRDIPELSKEIARNANLTVAMSLRDLIAFMENRWRLPDGGWTTDGAECGTAYEIKFNDLGCYAVTSLKNNYRPKPILLLDLLDFPRDAENRARVINLILTLEPESLMLYGAWRDITFLGLHTTLEELSLEDTLMTDLTPIKELQNLKVLNLKKAKICDLAPLEGLSNLRHLHLDNTKVTDLTPLKGVPNLESLGLRGTGVSDLTPLKELQELRLLVLNDTKVTDLAPMKGLKWLYLENTKVSDLTPLEGLPNLSKLHLKNTMVADLKPLKGLPELSKLNLENTKVTYLTPLKDLPKLSELNLKNTEVTDLTALKGLPWLRELNLDNTKVKDLTPLKGLPILKYIYLHNTGVTDLTPLEGMSVFIISGMEE